MVRILSWTNETKHKKVDTTINSEAHLIKREGRGCPDRIY
nr:MAG TPA: hypothetical protein [Caudoviricetes sp.]